jgi:hypothetical protein
VKGLFVSRALYNYENNLLTQCSHRPGA